MSPKLFISYSQTNAEHVGWVIKLGTDLRSFGVDVILDKWDLKEGHDAHAFMEQMVTDPEIKKVLLICDRAYAAKADKRTGGVGTEAQIITPEIYARQDQTKFVAVIAERDEDGNPFVPAYYKSRIYIDLSNESTFSDNFDQLLRWVYDQPLHKKPDLGQKPSFLIEDQNSIQIATGSRFRRAVEAVKSGREHAQAASTEYFDFIADDLEKFRLTSSGRADFDEDVVQNIDSFLPYRNELIEFFITVAMYGNERQVHCIHRFFERLIPYLSEPASVGRWNEWDFDNFKFITHELFLYAIACFFKNEKFEAAWHLYRNEYYCHRNSRYGRDAMASFLVFNDFLRSIQHRNDRLTLNRLSLHADLLEQRCKGSPIDFTALMQADFVLWLYSKVRYPNDRMWWPNTLVYAGRHHGPFEIFARAKSRVYFDQVIGLVGFENKDQLQEKIVAMGTDGRNHLPRWQFDTIEPGALLGLNLLATTR